MTTPILKSAPVSGVRRLLVGRPAVQAAAAVQPVRRDIKPPTSSQGGAASDAAPYLPQPVLASATAPSLVVDAARQDLDAQRESARRQGYEAGLAEGRQAGQDQARKEAAAAFAKQSEQIATLMKGLAHRFEGDIAGMDTIAVDIVMTACRKVFGDKVATAGADTLTAIIRSATATARGEEIVAVRIGPRDAALLAAATDSALPASLKLLADESLQPGDCIVEVAGGSIDARLESQYRLLGQALADAIQRMPQEAA